MKIWKRLRSAWGAIFGRARVESELDAELRFHVEAHAEDLMRAGLSREEAMRQARLKLGGFERTKEECRDALGVSFVESLIQDVRFGLRMLRKNPGFTAVAVITLALGIGANTAIFGVVEGVMLAPLPYREPDRLVVVGESNPRFPRVWDSYPNFLDRQRIARSFQEMAGIAWQGHDLTSIGTPEHIDGAEISSGFFSTLGVKLALGRDFSPSEDQHGGAPVVIISNRLWRNQFAGSPQALGKSVTLDGVDYTMVGVTPFGFQFERDADAYTPLGQGDPLVFGVRGAHWLFSIGRLKPGVSVSQAQAEMSTIQDRLDQLYPDANRDLGANVEPLKQVIVGNVGRTLLLLLGAVGLVLLIACANVANLLLARSAARVREFAIRSALGASRTRIVRQLLTESVTLSFAGSGLGLAVAAWGVKPILAAMPRTLPRSQQIALNIPVLLFALGIAVAVGIVFGLAPALKGSKSNLQETLQEGGRTTSTGRHRVQSALVIVQMALTLVLLAGAGLLFRTIRVLWNVNPGFDVPHLITFKVGVSPSLTKTASNTRIAYQQLIERIRQIPGVQAADFTDVVALKRQGGTLPFWIGSQKPASLQAAPRLVPFLTGPDYLRTMGIALLRGRFFTAQDTTESPCVVVIDSVFAEMYFSDSDPLGRTITFGFSPTPPCQIVGVVGHVKDWGLQDLATNIRNQVYFPLYQDPDRWVADNYAGLTVVVRTPLDSPTIMPAIKAAVFEAGSDQPVYDIRTMRQIASDSMSAQRFPMILLGVFAGLALLLASVGLYGVISYSVAQRVHEIGIRMALGAKPRDVLSLVLWKGARLAALGTVIGIAAALALTRLMRGWLYGVKATDPITFAAVMLILLAVALLASYIPARRAVRVDPMAALRHE